MGLLSKLLGNASEIDIEELQEEYRDFLTDTETIQEAYKVIRDLFIFTNKRLILVNKQGLTGKKVEYLSIPYHNITHFSIETAGHFDLDAELCIWIAGMGPEPIVKKFNKNLDIYILQSILAEYIMDK